MKAYLRRSDYLLIGLKALPTSISQRARAEWEKALVIAKAKLFCVWAPSRKIELEG